MKLFEDMAEMGGTINSVIQQMVNDMFQQELDDDEVAVSVIFSASDKGGGELGGGGGGGPGRSLLR